MKVIKWADIGACLLDPVSAHLITPRYEDGQGGMSAYCVGGFYV